MRTLLSVAYIVLGLPPPLKKKKKKKINNNSEIMKSYLHVKCFFFKYLSSRVLKKLFKEIECIKCVFIQNIYPGVYQIGLS